jgi:SSS family solute:Na+ symporter
VFAQFETVYAAHGAMTAAVTPPLVVALFLAVFWRRYTRQAALWTIVGGLAAIGASVFFPELIAPFAHGVPAGDVGDGVFAGARQHKFLRALFGLAASGAIGVAVTLVTRPEPPERQRGLVWGTIRDALAHYQGSPGEERPPAVARAAAVRAAEDRTAGGSVALPAVALSRALAGVLDARPGDLVFVSDARWWLGGLRSTHAIVGSLTERPGAAVELGPTAFADVVARGREARPVRVERLY